MYMYIFVFMDISLSGHQQPPGAPYACEYVFTCVCISYASYVATELLKITVCVHTDMSAYFSYSTSEGKVKIKLKGQMTISPNSNY